MLQFENLRKLPQSQFDYLVGFLPEMLNESNPEPAQKQLNEGYRHGGGWHPFKGFTWDKDKLTLTYPDDPPYHALARVKFRDQTIYVFNHSWVMVLEPSGTFEICRMD